MQRERIYISGQISGISHIEAKARFKRAERLLRASYPVAKIVNPMNKFFPRGMKWQWHMLYDLYLLSRCTHIYMLDGWQKSDGARIEYRWAKHIGLPVLNIKK